MTQVPTGRSGVLLVTRSWLASRRAVPAAVTTAAVAMILIPFPVGAVIRLSMWVQPPLDLFPVSVVAGCASVLGTIALAPLAPEWERPRRWRTRIAHLLTWLTMCGAVTLIAPVVTAIRLQGQVDHPSALVTTQVAILGLAGSGVGLLGRALGAVTVTAVLGTAAFLDQAQDLRWIWADTGQSPAWLVPLVLFVAGAAVQTATCGVPSWIERRGRAPE